MRSVVALPLFNNTRTRYSEPATPKPRHRPCMKVRIQQNFSRSIKHALAMKPSASMSHQFRMGACTFGQLLHNVADGELRKDILLEIRRSPQFCVIEYAKQ